VEMLLAHLFNLVMCRLDHYVQFSSLNEDSKLISMKRVKVNFI